MTFLTAAEAELRQRVGTNIRARRLRLGLTLKQASAPALLHWRKWQKIERGAVNVGLETLERMAIVMGVDASDLLRVPSPLVN
jgi:transcriptional regulator with XRE-family HTH domain